MTELERGVFNRAKPVTKDLGFFVCLFVLCLVLHPAGEFLVHMEKDCKM